VPLPRESDKEQEDEAVLEVTLGAMDGTCDDAKKEAEFGESIGEWGKTGIGGELSWGFKRGDFWLLSRGVVSVPSKIVLLSSKMVVCCCCCCCCCCTAEDEDREGKMRDQREGVGTGATDGTTVAETFCGRLGW
jgi:hypothetical protein